MRAKKGFTLTELVVSSSIMIFTLTGVLALLIGGLRSFERTTSDINLAQPNSQAIRRITENLRQAMSVTLNSSKDRVTFTLPATQASADSITGEKELAYPLVGDGITRYYEVKKGVLYEQPGNRQLMSGLVATDPDPKSSQYKKTYEPFQATTLGARNAVTINLITQETVNGKPRYVRMKSTVMVQNIR